MSPSRRRKSLSMRITFSQTGPELEGSSEKMLSPSAMTGSGIGSVTGLAAGATVGSAAGAAGDAGAGVAGESGLS
jgi:hypothetical protein